MLHLLGMDNKRRVHITIEVMQIQRTIHFTQYEINLPERMTEK